MDRSGRLAGRPDIHHSACEKRNTHSGVSSVSSVGHLARVKCARYRSAALVASHGVKRKPFGWPTGPRSTKHKSLHHLFIHSCPITINTFQTTCKVREIIKHYSVNFLYFIYTLNKRSSGQEQCEILNFVALFIHVGLPVVFHRLVTIARKKRLGPLLK